MTKILKSTLVLTLILALSVILVACRDTAPETPETPETPDTSVWSDATYTADTTLGEGEKTIVVEVRAEDKSVEITLSTDAKTLGEALLEHGLISGEEGPYGLYVKTVNGMLADYDTDQTYWALYKNGEMTATGVDTTEISDGEHYELVKQK